MIIVEAIKHAVKRVFDYRSRATRSEFWWFAFVFIVWIILAAVIDQVVFEGGEQYSALYNISGFWVLIIGVPFGAIPLLIMLVLPGTSHGNRFGGTSDDDDWLLFD